MNHRSESNALRKLGYHVTSRCRCAARYARITGSSICDAAIAFGVNAGGVWNAWDRIYPMTPHPTSVVSRRSTCTACGATGHIAVRGECSPTERAMRLVSGGATVPEAARLLGLSNQTVYQARDHRRRAA